MRWRWRGRRRWGGMEGTVRRLPRMESIGERSEHSRISWAGRHSRMDIQLLLVCCILQAFQTCQEIAR